MSRRPDPDFTTLLGPFVGSVPEAGRPGFLARLERGAAARYRAWAAADGVDAEGLLDCAAREEEIADRVDRLFPVGEALARALAEALPGAREATVRVFSGLGRGEQLALQAKAERAGAAAWRDLASRQPDAVVARELETCARLEEANASYLESRTLESGTRRPAP